MEREFIIKSVATLLFIIVIWGLSPIIIDSYLLPLLDIQKTELSDLYTAVAALFSALAFAGIMLTLVVQNKQVELQKDEIEAQRLQANIITEIAAYTALLTYYDSNSYEPTACELTPMDIAKRLNKLLLNPCRSV